MRNLPNTSTPHGTFSTILAPQAPILIFLLLINFSSFSDVHSLIMLATFYRATFYQRNHLYDVSFYQPCISMSLTSRGGSSGGFGGAPAPLHFFAMDALRGEA
jgi:hypothetical protein